MIPARFLLRLASTDLALSFRDEIVAVEEEVEAGDSDLAAECVSSPLATPNLSKCRIDPIPKQASCVVPDRCHQRQITDSETT